MTQLPGVLARLRDSGLAPRKRLGQHFLHDPQLLRALVSDAGVTASDHVFEVGTGPGTLTRELALRARSVLSVDVDPGLLAFARDEIGPTQNVELLEVNAIEKGLRLAGSLRDRLRSEGRFLWVSNLPYGIASPLIVAVLQAELPWASASVLVQDEVAERLASRPGSKTYGALTALVAFWARVTLGRKIPPGAFWPPPAVHSRVVHLEPSGPLGRAEEFAPYSAWVKRLFQGRRKQVGGLLRGLLGPELARAAAINAQLLPSQRPEQLRPEDFLRLAREFPAFSL